MAAIHLSRDHQGAVRPKYALIVSEASIPLARNLEPVAAVFGSEAQVRRVVVIR